MQYHNAGTAGMLPVLQVIFSQKTLLIRLAVKARGREGVRVDTKNLLPYS